MPRCQCKTKKGDRCKRNVAKGKTKYCKQHSNCSNPVGSPSRSSPKKSSPSRSSPKKSSDGLPYYVKGDVTVAEFKKMCKAANAVYDAGVDGRCRPAKRRGTKTGGRKTGGHKTSKKRGGRKQKFDYTGYFITSTGYTNRLTREFRYEPEDFEDFEYVFSDNPKMFLIPRKSFEGELWYRLTPAQWETSARVKPKWRKLHAEYVKKFGVGKRGDHVSGYFVTNDGSGWGDIQYANCYGGEHKSLQIDGKKVPVWIHFCESG